LTTRSANGASPILGRPPVLRDIVEEHFEELDFLWEVRESVIFAPDWNLEELAELEERAEAHLDGLRLAELHAVDVARPHLAGEHRSGATAATFVFMESGDPELAGGVLAALANADAPARDGIRIGLRHSRIDAIETQLFELAASGPSCVRAEAADVLAFHRRRVPDISALLTDNDTRLLAFGALGRVGRGLDERTFLAALDSEAGEVRCAVLEAAARSRMPGLDELCRLAALRADHPDLEALAFLGVLAQPQDLKLLISAAERADTAAAAARALGAFGRLEAIPVLLRMMESAKCADAAGAAFTRITGAQDVETPVEQTAGVAGDIDAEFADESPRIDATRAAAWWRSHESRFQRGARWQAGRNVDGNPLDLDDLPLAVRRDLYLGARGGGSGSVPDRELEARAVLQAPAR